MYYSEFMYIVTVTVPTPKTGPLTHDIDFVIFWPIATFATPINCIQCVTRKHVLCLAAPSARSCTIFLKLLKIPKGTVRKC